MSAEYHAIDGTSMGVYLTPCGGCGCLLANDPRYRSRHAEVCAGKDLPDPTVPTGPVRELPPVIVTRSRYSPSDVWPEGN